MIFNFSLMCVFALFGSYLIEEVEVGGGTRVKGWGGSWRSPLREPVTGKGRFLHVLTGGRIGGELSLSEPETRETGRWLRYRYVFADLYDYSNPLAGQPLYSAFSCRRDRVWREDWE